jgi:phospholipase D1/2
MEKRSGVGFEQAEVALARQWLGSDHAQPNYKVKIKTVATTQGDLTTTDTSEMKQKQQVKEVTVPQTLRESADVIRQFENGATRSDHRVSDSVSQHVQLDRTPLRREEWLGTREEERNASVTSLSMLPEILFSFLFRGTVMCPIWSIYTLR